MNYLKRLVIEILFYLSWCRSLNIQEKGFLASSLIEFFQDKKHKELAPSDGCGRGARSGRESGAAAAIQAATGGRGVDRALDCAAKADTTNQAIRPARNPGPVTLTGIHSAALVPFEVSPMRRKELAILNVRRSNHDIHQTLCLLVERIAWFAPLVTHTRPIGRIAEAFRLNEGYEDGVGKLVIHPGE